MTTPDQSDFTTPGTGASFGFGPAPGKRWWNMPHPLRVTASDANAAVDRKRDVFFENCMGEAREVAIIIFAR